MKFEDLPTEKIYKYMPFSGSSHKLLFRFDGLKSCRYRESNMDDVVDPFNGCYVVENSWDEVLGVCDFFSLLWFSTINGQLWGTEFYCKKGLLKDFYEKFIDKRVISVRDLYVNLRTFIFLKSTRFVLKDPTSVPFIEIKNIKRFLNS